MKSIIKKIQHFCGFDEQVDVSLLFVQIAGIILLLFLIANNATAGILEDDQKASVRFTGEYFSDTSNPEFTVNTYETICKGYYTIDRTGDNVIVTGFGDLADEYTYEYPNNEKLQKDISLPTTTKPVDIVPLDNASSSGGDRSGDSLVPLDL